MKFALLAALDGVLPDPLFIHDQHGLIVAVNDKACESLGYSRDELLSMSIMDVVTDKEPASLRALWNTVTRDYAPLVRGRQRRKNGSDFPVEVRIALVEHDGKRHYFAIARDLSDRLRVETRLRDHLSHAHTIFETMAEGLTVQDSAGAILDANPAAEHILGLTREQLLGRSSLDPDWRCVHEDGSDFPGEEHPSMVALRSGEPVRNRLMGVHDPKTGLRWLSVNARPVFRSGMSRPNQVVTTFVDVTALHESRRRLRELAQRLETVREDERCVIAERLHEGVAQDLYALKLALQYEDKAAQTGADPLMARAEVMATLDRCIDSTRAMANQLRPATITHLPGSGAIRHHAQYVGQVTGLDIGVHESPALPELTEAVRLMLFRIVQEALDNVSRHAGATRVDITLRAEPSRICLDISDDGIGAGEESFGKPGGLGLLGLRERLLNLGGGLQIARRGSRGTTLSVWLPLESTPAANGDTADERRSAG